MTSNPTLILFAGANGSGKTTAARYLLPREHILEFVNADEIARGLSPLNPSGQAVKAGRLVLERMRELIASRRSFAVETTLSGKGLAKYLRLAKEAGYQVEMNFLFCSDVRFNIQRIKRRVIQGGHHVPSDDVRRRYWRGLVNLYSVYGMLCDKITVYDATERKPEPFLMWAGTDVVTVYNSLLYDPFKEKVDDAFKRLADEAR
jgi:predicted ABC-type ATPase